MRYIHEIYIYINIVVAVISEKGTDKTLYLLDKFSFLSCYTSDILFNVFQVIKMSKKSFNCPEKGCFRSYTTKGNLQTHLKAHRGIASTK